jgi:hypothetical protein
VGEGPHRLGPRIGAPVQLGGDRQVDKRHEAAHLAVLVPDNLKTARLQLEPALRDARGCLPLGGRYELENARGVSGSGRFGVVLPPRLPVDRRQDPGQIAKQELQVEDGALLVSPA